MAKLRKTPTLCMLFFGIRSCLFVRFVVNALALAALPAIPNSEKIIYNEAWDRE
jgi:hypothetical protein